MRSLLLLVGQAVASSSALLFLRAALPKVQALKFASGIGPLTQFAVGGVLYVGSFLVWLYILSKSQVTYAYPVSVALTVVFTTLGAILFLGERFSWSMFGGILLILGGIALLTIRSN